MSAYFSLLERVIKNAVCIAIFLLANSCEHAETTKQNLYYPSGLLKKSISKKNGKWHGEVINYYSNGRIESKSMWSNDLQHGPAFFYYSNGRIKELTQWSNGQANGQSILNYTNGRMRRKSYFSNGIESGEIILFDSLENPIELQVKDSRGRLVRVTSYDNGIARPGGAIPFFNVNDTVSLGENIVGYAYFAYPPESMPIMYIGRTSNKRVMTDTLDVIHPNPKGRYYFKYRPNKLGNDSFGYEFFYSIGRTDTAAHIRISGKYGFFVKKQ